MTILAWPALLLLITGGVLLILATMGSGPRHRDVGTLLIWKRVAEKRTTSNQRRRTYDLLLWLSLSAVLLGALAAARPGLTRAQPKPRIAVFVEATGGGGAQLDLTTVKSRTEAVADAEFVYFMAREQDSLNVRLIADGPIQAQLAKFERASSEFDGRILMLNEPTAHSSELGLVIPRVTERRSGIVFQISARDDRIVVKQSAGGPLDVLGAQVIETIASARESTLVLVSDSERITVSIGDGRSVSLNQRKLAVGIGTGWSTQPHLALFAALALDDASDVDVQVWLGSDERTPAIRVNQGASAAPSNIELSFDPQHALFRDLPLRDFDWLASGRVMALDDSARPLMRAVADGEAIGDIIRLRGDVFEFAGDPFSDSPIASSALLLDNAIGILTGERPSERERYEIAGDDELPTRRAALAEPFDPVGSLDLYQRSADEPLEFATWFMLLAGMAAISAGALATKQKPRARARGL